jgi:oligoribonuclease NrnB/cAMP/cGMP phosphodiesterase (DHH superfamily)
MKTIGIYHSKDLDGFTSGAIIKLKYPDAKMIGYDYGMEFTPKEIITEPTRVIISDVSFPMEKMVEIAELSMFNTTWIDHHISAINDYSNFKQKNKNIDFVNPVLDTNFAACELTWNHIFNGNKMPLAVKLLGEYDSWRNSDKDRWDNEILPFQFGMRIHCNSLDTFPTDLLFNNSLVKNIINEGKLILKYQKQINEVQCKTSAFDSKFEGLNAICLNNGGFNSDVFNSVYDESKHDIMIPFQFNGKMWKLSLYTTKDNVDCSQIAKKYGGGGHKKASGFSLSDIKTIFPNIE